MCAIAKNTSLNQSLRKHGQQWLRDFLHLHRNCPKVSLGAELVTRGSLGIAVSGVEMIVAARQITARGTKKRRKREEKIFEQWFDPRDRKKWIQRIRLPTLTIIIRVAYYLNVRIMSDTIQYNFPFRLSAWSLRRSNPKRCARSDACRERNMISLYGQTTIQREVLILTILRHIKEFHSYIHGLPLISSRSGRILGYVFETLENIVKYLMPLPRECFLKYPSTAPSNTRYSNSFFIIAYRKNVY